MRDLEGLRVLDYGCGYGDLTFAISKTNPVVGIDIDHDRIAFARGQYPELEFRSFACDNAPFSDQSFDVVLSCVVLPFVSDYALYLHDVRRLLIDDGTLVIVTCNSPVVQNFFRVVAGRPPIQSKMDWLPGQLSSALKRLGFAIDKSDYFYDPPFVDCRGPKDVFISGAEQFLSLARVASAANYFGFRARACGNYETIDGNTRLSTQVKAHPRQVKLRNIPNVANRVVML